MDNFKKQIAQNIFGITKEVAIEKQICIKCRNSIKGRIHTEAGRREYMISGMCEVCFDSLFSKESDV